ncbi:MAG: DUF3089 domain-containing protein [Bacteroidota bacterium]|jgi:hypothetical protein
MVRLKSFYWVFLIVLLGVACSPKISSYTGKQVFKTANGVPDYADLNYWSAHPNKWDPSDTIPKLLRGNPKEKDVDVFYIHPTTYTGEMPEGKPNAEIDDSTLNYKTDYSPMLYQASVFNERARVFAPRYRQAHIKMYGEQDSVKLHRAFNLAYDDVKRAFQYYLEKENNGRPIIIASHSQGTTHSSRLLKEFFDGKPLIKQLVCAYIIGIRLKKDIFNQIPVCTDASQTGCFVSWRTYRYDYMGDWVSRLDTSVAVVNPMSWKTDEQWVDKSAHKGAVLYNMNKIYKNTQSALVEGDVLRVTHPKFPGSFLYKSKNYHAGDINLFYVDIRENVSNRIGAFQSKK